MNKKLIQKWLGWIIYFYILLSAGNNAIALNTVTYFHNDVSGTPMLATDASGGVVWKETYRPYGQKLTNSPASANNKVGFAGKPYDGNTGLSYMGARYYDPVVGRFMGIDPKEVDPNDLHSFNRYAYANNNPYKFVDPDGHSPLVAVAVGVILWTGFEMLPGPNVPWNSGMVLPATLPDVSAALKGVGLAAGLVGSMKQSAFRDALEGSADQAAVKGATGLRNSHLAESVHPKTGIPFDKAGYPDFSGVAKAEVKISQTGTRAGDFRAANQAAGMKNTPEGYTWHHHQDGTTMQLVPRDIHAKTGHTGGFLPKE
jgi:RHS repeat-associated protein